MQVNKPFKLKRLVGIMGVLCMAPLFAEDIPEGTLISKNNIDSLLSKTFEGKTLDELMPESQKKMVREYGVTMSIAASKPILHEPLFVEATKKYASEVKLDPNTLAMSGFVTGVPFPDITKDDPLGGVKAIYNFMRSPWSGDVMEFTPMTMLPVNGKSGLERELKAKVAKMLLQGRLKEPHQLDDEQTTVTIMVFTYPNDAKGVGVLNIMYEDGRLPDVYAYIKPVRRVRRLSGNAWADPLGGTDLLADEQTGYNADPRWYKKISLKGERWILAAAHSINPGINKNAASLSEHYGIKVDQPPYWDYEDQFEPRKVWTVEIETPETHVSSKKVYYFDQDPYCQMPWMFESYDRKGALWRWMDQGLYEYKMDDGLHGYGVGIVRLVDLQRWHATVTPSSRGVIRANFEASPQDYAPTSLSRLLSQ